MELTILKTVSVGELLDICPTHQNQATQLFIQQHLRVINPRNS